MPNKKPAAFYSKKQQRFMFAKHPKIAGKMVKDAKKAGKPTVKRKRRRRK